MGVLAKDFYLDGSVTEIAQRLLGKILYTNINGKISSGIIVETEAYCGRDDKACHANNGRRTKRNEIMYAQGGMVYVYFCYGIHTMFNVVTNVEGKADAVLVRAVQPVEGLSHMMERKNTSKADRLSSGPGNVCKSLGIELRHNGFDLGGDDIWLEDAMPEVPFKIYSATRIGVDYAEEDAKLLWRYYIKGNKWVSKS